MYLAQKRSPTSFQRCMSFDLSELSHLSRDVKRPQRWDPGFADVPRCSSSFPLDTARLSGSRLLLDETVRTGLAFTTKRELEGTQTSKHEFSIYTHASLSTRSRDCYGKCRALALGSAMDSTVGAAATVTYAPPHSSNTLVVISTLCQKYVQGTYALPSPQPMHLRRHVHDNRSP
jgi:hypothetical protein